MKSANGLSNSQHDLTDFTSLLDQRSHQFLQPTLTEHRNAVAATKALLDPLAAHISANQVSRRDEGRRKRKRGSDEVEDPVLQLKQVYTTGLGVKQIWEQARRILDAACDETERAIALHLPDTASEESADGNSFSDISASELEDAEEDSQEENFDLEQEEGLLDEEIENEDADSLEDNDDIEDDIGPDLTDSDAEILSRRPQTTYTQDPNKLNDGFFSIDDFNKQSQFLEQMDARGDDDNPSDEDEVDWDANPFAVPETKGIIPGRAAHRDDDDDDADEDADMDEDDGPTFGNADLDAMQDDSEEEEEGTGGDLDGMMTGLVNTNEIRYADFFEPPPKKPSKSKRTRALPKTQPAPEPLGKGYRADNEEGDEDMERAIADVRRDLLEPEDGISEDDEEASDMSDDSDSLPRLSAYKLKDKNLSTHEKQKLQIAEEIRRLEKLNVSKKSWTLSGEASANARPLNSLIEEDLEFERTGKPVPVVTAEVSNDLEALIKRRILARDFDEVVRRRPTTVDSAADARRGRMDAVVDDSKPQASLGELYESEYQKNTDPTSYIDKRSAATKKQHAEIDKVWNEVREQLDVLGNLHVKPKRAEIEIKTVEDKPVIAMEDARPAISGSGMDDNGTMLAPQEVYKPGVDSRADQGEIVSSKSGAGRSKEEMTREEKMRRRRRDKERHKKASQSSQTQKMTNGTKDDVKASKDKVLKDLQKGGVKMIQKGGKVADLSGKPKKGANGERAMPTSGGALKL